MKLRVTGKLYLTHLRKHKDFITSTKFYEVLNVLSKPQLNHNSTQPNITLSWVRHENDFAHHPTPHPHKLNVSYISAVTYPILMKL